jgi:hypothetical protein
MASGAPNRTGNHLFGLGLLMTIDTGQMGGYPHGRGFFLIVDEGLFFMTIPAGTLFSFGIKEFLALFVKFVVAAFTLILLGTVMSKVEGFVETESNPRRSDLGSFPVTVIAFDRACLFSGSKNFSVAFCAVVTINFRQFFLIDIFNPHKFQRDASVFVRMTGGAAFIFLFQGIGVLVV